MRKTVFILTLLVLCTGAWAQKKEIRQGNREFRREEFAKADISYRKALVADSSSVAARYNLANNLYRQGSMDEAAKQLDAVKESGKEEAFGADILFNRGDVAIAKEDWKTAVDCFKEYLKANPDDMGAKENFVYARNKLMEQQSQDQQEQEQNQDQQQDQQQQPDQNQEQQNQEQQQQEQEAQISPQQAQQLLQAIQEKERQTQEKALKAKSRQKEKNW